MYQQVSIILLSIFFFTTTTHGGRIPFNKPYGSGPASDGSALDVIQSIDSQNILNLIEKLKRDRRNSIDEQQQFREQMLEAHNQYRAQHCAPPLTLDDALNDGAQQYAEYLVEIDSLVHSGADGLGENLYMSGSSDAISGDNVGRDATDAWYNEVNQYDFNQGGFSMETGHFTQLVWKSSEKLGAGMAFNNDRTKVYVVARYSPPGNYEGQYGDNVFPAGC